MALAIVFFLFFLLGIPVNRIKQASVSHFSLATGTSSLETMVYSSVCKWFALNNVIASCQLYHPVFFYHSVTLFKAKDASLYSLPLCNVPHYSTG